MIQIINDDCLSAMALELEENSVDAIVCDPPYGIKFMNKKWDYDVPSIAIWEECLRVLKPGGHLLAFAGTRTQHRMCCNIEDAGFVIKDLIFWCYGSGFPKSRDISKAIDSEAGAVREVTGVRSYGDGHIQNSSVDKLAPPIGTFKRTQDERLDTAPATEEAKQWDGWGTALKPALEIITLARKPLSEKTIAANVLRWGTGGLNIGACRVPTNGENPKPRGRIRSTRGKFESEKDTGYTLVSPPDSHPKGRWPANLIHDGSAEVVDLFPQSKSTGGSGPASKKYKSDGHTISGSCAAIGGFGDSGSAARFFYCAKASKKDRNEGLEDFPAKFAPTTGNGIGGKEHNPKTATPKRNPHPTVKPTALMRYLCRLITQPGGVVLDPFMGSGSTGKAAVLEGFDFIGIELEEEDCKIAERRIEHAKNRA